MKLALVGICLTLAACSPLLNAASIATPVAQTDASVQTQPQTSQNTLITMERTACFGMCPAYRLTIAGNGQVTYQGIAFVGTQGTKTIQLSPEQVGSLLDEFAKANFFDLKNEYTVNVTDLPGTRTTIQLDGRSKTVWHYGSVGDPNLDSAPAALSRLEAKIDQIVNSSQWVDRQR